MKFPLASTVSIGKYVAAQQRKGERYPLVLMLEPTLACNIACIGCGKIREYESNRARLSVEECVDAAVQCPAPVVSICGGEPLVYKGIDEVVTQVLDFGKTIELCTNALRLEQCLDWFEPSNRLTFVIHLDGMREIHDYVCDYPGLWDIAIDAIKTARGAGFRVTTNTTIFKETEVGDVVEMMRYLTDEVGIDGMMIAPGYQYSQIDPALTMTRDEHEEKFRVIRAATKEHGYRWIASPIYQDFLTGQRELTCAPWGSITRNPYGWKGPVLPADRRHLPDVRGAARGDGVGGVRPRQRPALRALRHPLRVRAVGGVRGLEQPERDRAESRVDADGLTFAVATTAEERVAKRLGLNTVRVGVCVANGVPEGSLVSFGLAGSLGELQIGDVLDATRVVDETGATLWEGPGLGVRGARGGVVLGGDVLVHDATERERLRQASGADAVDMESGVLARSGRLAGVVRAISDDAGSTVAGVDTTVHADGRTNVAGLLRWVFARRGGAIRSMRDAVRALHALEQAVAT